MKSIEQMGIELIRVADAERERTGGHWPIPMAIGMCITLAWSEEEAQEIERENNRLMIFTLAVFVLGIMAIIAILIGGIC
ncbi:hypothetical protein ACW910_24235 (plasmid) [Burkholderia ambifaria]